MLKQLKYLYVYLSVMLGDSLKQCDRYEREINLCQDLAIPPDPKAGRLRHGPLRL